MTNEQGSRSVVPTFRKSRKVGQPGHCQFRRNQSWASPHLSKVTKGGATGCLLVQAKSKLGRPPPLSRSGVGSVMIQSGGHGFHNGAGCVIVLESPDVCAAQAVVPAFVHVEHFEADGKRILEVPESA